MAEDSAMLTGVKGPVQAMLPAAMPVPSALPCAMKRHAVWYEDCTSMLAAPLKLTFCMQQALHRPFFTHDRGLCMDRVLAAVKHTCAWTLFNAWTAMMGSVIGPVMFMHATECHTEDCEQDRPAHQARWGWIQGQQGEMAPGVVPRSQQALHQRFAGPANSSIAACTCSE